MIFYLLIDGEWRNAPKHEESLQNGKLCPIGSITDAVGRVKRSIVTSHWGIGSNLLSRHYHGGIKVVPYQSMKSMLSPLRCPNSCGAGIAPGCHACHGACKHAQSKHM